MRRSEAFGLNWRCRCAVGEAEPKPRDLGSDRGYRAAKVGLRQDASVGRSEPRPYNGENAGRMPALPVHEALGEGVVAGADAHGVVPGDRECPPHQSTENGLAHREWQDVALAREE
jgi:threonine dehydrogenase-like Zn-dependent dehydrogenase